MASIVEKHLTDGSRAYLVRYRTSDGQQRSRQFKRKKDAEAHVNLIEVDRLQGALIDPRLGRITVAEWWDRWWPTVTNLRPSTKARDAQFFRTHALPTFGRTPIGKLDRTALRAWVAELGSPDGSNLAPATIHRVVQLLNKCIEAAFEDRLVSHNPVAKLPLPRIERREMRFVNADELMRLAETIDPRYRAFVLLGGFAGLRLGEMLGLRWGRVDLLRRRVHVAETLVDIGGHISFGPPKTRAAVRSVPLPVLSPTSSPAWPARTSPPASWCSVHPKARRFGPRSFAGASGLRRSTAAGVAPLRIHDLRHTAVSLWIADGANPKQIAVMAGHTSVSVVLDRYGHLYSQHDDELMDRLERRAAATTSLTRAPAVLAPK